MNFAKSILTIAAAIIVTGFILDECGKGTFGATVKSIAQKATSGYGA